MAAPAAVFAEGWQHHQAGDLPKAEAAYRTVLENDPDHAEAWALLGAARLAAGRPADAEAALRQALALRPDHAGAHDNLGVTLSRHGRLDEAAACYRQALRLN